MKNNKPPVPYSAMTDSELAEWVVKYHSGKTVLRFKKDDPDAHSQFFDRGMIPDFIDHDILNFRQRREKGYFKTHSVKEYIANNYQGKTVNFIRLNDRNAYVHGAKQGALDELVAEGKIIRICGYDFSKMNDDGIVKYVTEHRKRHFSQLADDVKKEIISRGLFGRLSGVIKYRGPRRAFYKMSNYKFLRFIDREYHGVPLGVLATIDPGAYRTLGRRDLLEKAVEKEFLVRVNPNASESHVHL